MRRGRFDPQPISLYRARLVRELAQAFRSGFLRSPGGLRTFDRPYGLETLGELECKGGIRIDVEERLEWNRSWFGRRDHVVLVEYLYNARVPGLGRGLGMIFRYNSPHPTHNKFHHVHRFDTLGTGEQIMPPTFVKAEMVPTVRQVLQEAELWYYDHRDRIADDE